MNLDVKDSSWLGSISHGLKSSNSKNTNTGDLIVIFLKTNFILPVLIKSSAEFSVCNFVSPIFSVSF